MLQTKEEKAMFAVIVLESLHTGVIFNKSGGEEYMNRIDEEIKLVQKDILDSSKEYLGEKGREAEMKMILRIMS